MIQFAIRSLHSPSEFRNYDNSGMGPGYNNDTNPDKIILPPIDNAQQNSTTIDTSGHVVDFNQENFCQRLVEHFDIMYQQNKVVWPRSNKSKPKHF